MDQDQPDATAIWDERYEKGGHVGTARVIEGDPVDFTQHKFLYGHSIAKPMTGALDGWSINEIGRKFLQPPAGKVLSIGSGMAFIEEHLLDAGMAEHILAYEMSPTACRAAMERVAEKPYAGRLEMRSADVLHEDLPTGAFDLVFVQAAIHHFAEIEDMFRLMHRVLKPGGLLWYDEYVGPDHHIYDDSVNDLIDQMNACLAERYRYNVLEDRVRDRGPLPSLEFMLQHDPSEGVHASRILPLTYQYFDVVHRQDYAGAALRPFYTGILPNFDWSSDADQTIGRLTILIEKLMTERGAIPSYHSAVVARRRDAIRAPLTAAEAERINCVDWKGLAAAVPVAAETEPTSAVGVGGSRLRILLRRANTLRKLLLR